MKALLTGIMLSILGLVLSSIVLANPLTDAIGNGDIDAVRNALKKGGNVNSKGPGNTPTLHMAISMGHIDIARLLIEKRPILEPEMPWDPQRFMRPLTGSILS